VSFYLKTSLVETTFLGGSLCQMTEISDTTFWWTQNKINEHNFIKNEHLGYMRVKLRVDKRQLPHCVFGAGFRHFFPLFARTRKAKGVFVEFICFVWRLGSIFWVSFSLHSTKIKQLLKAEN
jgi:hypothetical protein